MKKTVLRIVAAIAVVLAVATVGGSFYMIDYALSSAKRTHRPDIATEVRRYPELRPWIDSLQRAGALRDTFAVMPSGARLHAVFVRSPRAFGRTAVVVHGYSRDAVDMLHIARIYAQDMGYNIILPDLHGHGQSDGDDIQMGWNDRLDVLQWIGMAERMFAEPGKSSRMVVHGISMGAATTMCVAGETTPDYVKCFVEDCGYTSVWDEFAHELRDQFSLPAFPLLYTTSALCRLKYGWWFGEASPLKQVAKCCKPMLFIHGGNDDFVPTPMVFPLYNAKPAPKQLWVARGSAHAVAYRDHKTEYARLVKNFVTRWNR